MKHMLEIRRGLFKFLRFIMRKDSLVNLTFTGYIEGKRSIGSFIGNRKPKLYEAERDSWMREEDLESLTHRANRMKKSKGKQEVTYSSSFSE